MYSAYSYRATDEMWSLVGYLIGALIVCVVFGAICEHIVKNKGYDGGGFLWGFFLTWIGVIVCALKSEAPKPDTSRAKGLSYSGLNDYSLNAGSPPPRTESFWNCSACGSKNGDAYTTCYRCGKNRYTKAETNPVIAAGSSVSLEKKESSAGDTAEQIKSFKKLLDDGIITEEEFAAKKKQILGI